MSSSALPLLSVVGVAVLVIVGTVLIVRSGRKYRAVHGRGPSSGQKLLFLGLAVVMMLAGLIITRASS